MKRAVLISSRFSGTTGSACRFTPSGWSAAGLFGRRRRTARSRSLQLSSACCSRAYRNIPSCESDESPIEEVRVLDPRHPLYGRSFRVIRRSTHCGGNFPPSYEVEHCNGSSLLIPIAVTEWHDSPNNRTILSIEALQDLLSVVDCFCSHERESKRSVDDTAANIAAPDRRRRRRSPGGDPS